MAADDDESVEGGTTTSASPSRWPPPLAIDAEQKARRGQGPELSPEEERDYEEIEAQFQLFKARQSEVERNVAQLLDRLNTRIHIPSSVASSECGDMTSLASSEWDTESLCPTEDGLSVFESRIGSRAGTPPLVGSPGGSPRQEHLTPLQRVAASSGGLMPWHMPPAMDSRTSQKSSFTSTMGTTGASSGMFASSERARASDGTAAEGGERGDLSGRIGALRGVPARKDLSPSAKQLARDRDLSRSPPRDTPRLTQQLLEQASRAGMEGTETAASLPTADLRWSSPPPHKEQHPDAAAQARSLSQLAPQPDAEDGHTDKNTRLPQFGAPGVNEAGGDEDEEELRRWQGWTVVATQEGRLFFHNDARQVSQWSQPPELRDILGDWAEIVDESQPSQPRFWRNELLRISLWKDPRSTTNIFQAALDGNLFFMQLYAEVEGQLDVVDPRGRSALHYSCAGGSTQSALFLLQRQAEVDRRDESAATPLIFACRYGYAGVVKVLLDHMADLSAACDGGNTALHEAASMGQLDCLHLLLLRGAEAGCLNNEGEAPVDLAANKRHHACLTLLRRHHQQQQQQQQQSQQSQQQQQQQQQQTQTQSGQLPPNGPVASLEEVPAAAGDRSEIRCRKPKQGNKTRHGGAGSASDSDGAAAAKGRLDRDGADSGGAASSGNESSDGTGGGFKPRRPQHRGRERRRERSPVALGLLSRLRLLPQWLDAARRLACPVRAEPLEQAQATAAPAAAVAKAE